MAQELALPNGSIVKQRNTWAPLGLAIITLGIYLIFWWYFINRELRDAGQENSPGLATLAYTVGGLILVPPFITTWGTGRRIKDAQTAASGVEGVCSPGIGLVLFFFLGIFMPVYYQSQLNHLWATYSARGATEV